MKPAIEVVEQEQDNEFFYTQLMRYVMKNICNELGMKEVVERDGTVRYMKMAEMVANEQ